jgi:hypothetical protein
MVDRIYRSGRWQLSRRLPAIVGFLLAAVGLVGLQLVDSPLGYAAMLAVAIFGADMTLSPSWAFFIDTFRYLGGEEEAEHEYPHPRRAFTGDCVYATQRISSTPC